ncbi:hypothetical protein ACH4TX_19700 [Streptomyces sp. NPDC021098]|uniref:hypothetical protein n=1 Tax=unclassified Streptomyces TaxID=2593676 RepID=UPI0037A75647
MRRRRWWLFSPLIPLVRSANRVAKRLFDKEGGGRVRDQLVERVQLARSVLGVLATVALVYVYGADGGWSGAATDGAANLFLTPFLLLLAGPLVVFGFILYAPSHRRPELRSRLGGPLKTVGWYVLTLGAFGAFAYVVGQTTLLHGLHGVTLFAVGLPLMVGLPWALVFLFLASAYVARSAFNTAYVHAALPPVLTGVLVWLIAIFTVLPDGLPDNGPLAAQLCAVFGGPLSVTALSLWELRRLRTHHGVTIRG